MKAETANAEMMRVEEVLEAAVQPDAVKDAVDLMDRLHSAMCK